MQEKLKNMVKKVKGFFTNMNKKTRTIAGAVLGGVVVAVVVIAFVIGNRPYNVLFTGLSADELSSIVTYLNDKGVTDYKVQGTDTILVAKNQEAQLKANLLMEGYPKSGFAYATYKAGVGSMMNHSYYLVRETAEEIIQKIAEYTAKVEDIHRIISIRDSR